MDAVGQDLVYSLRTLLKAPKFTVVAVVTLALGIGVNSAIFSVLDAVLLRPLPFAHSERVVNVAWEGGGHLQQLSAAKFKYWQEHVRSFDAMATWRSVLGVVDAGDATAAVRTLEVTPDFLRATGYTPALGRDFTIGEDMAGERNIAIISHGLWRGHFGSAADVVGRSVRLDGEPLTIVGVLPESFAFPYESESVEVLVPLRLAVDPDDVAENWPAIARLGPGFTREQAQAEVASVNAPFRAAYPGQISEQDRGMVLATFNELYIAPGVRRALWILMGTVTLVLLIACTNVANLFLTRAASRRGEIALRVALGATRGRIARLVLTESVLVALGAGTLGLLIGSWIAVVLVALTPVEVLRMELVGIHSRVILFTFAVSVGTTLLFGGIAAAWPAVGARLPATLSQMTRGRTSGRPARQGLLVAQSALSLVLLVGAGLLLTTLVRLMRVDPGFDVHGIASVRIVPKPAGYESPRDVWEFQRQVIQRLETASGVSAIAGASSLPLERGINTPMSIAGRPDVWGTVEWRAVTPSYFSALGITLVAGRPFDDTHLDGSLPVALINQAFAGRYFPNENPIGQRIEVGRVKGELKDSSRVAPPVEIIGIVADIRDASLRNEPRRTMYVPLAQAPTYLANVLGTMPVFIVRTRSIDDIRSALTQALRTVDPTLPMPQVFPLENMVTRSLARERFGATLLAVLAALAVALTALGVYGVLGYTVQQRRREIGIRMAVGAESQQVARFIMAQGIRPVMVGILLGLVISLGLARFIAAFLWGVAPTDPTTLAAVAAILLGVAVLASWIPARTAAAMDPVKSLSCE